MENPKLDQMLAMLQGMSEKISEFDLRMVAVEKKSDAAREAVDAIKKVDKEVSPRKATDRARENQKEVRRRAKLVGSRYPAESSRDQEQEEEVRCKTKLEGTDLLQNRVLATGTTEGRRRAKLVRSSSDPRKKERKKEASPRKAKEVLGSKRKQFVARKSLRSHGERRRRWKVRLKEQKTPFRE